MMYEIRHCPVCKCDTVHLIVHANQFIIFVCLKHDTAEILVGEESCETAIATGG